MFHSKHDVDRHVGEIFKNIKSESQRNLRCHQIAKLYYKFKDYKSAIKYLNRYISTSSNSAAAQRLLGDCYLGLNLKVKALSSYKASLEHNGTQHDLVLKICSLLTDPEVFAVTPRATYWLDRAESLFPTNPIVFQLKEHILKSNLDGKHDSGQLEKLILSEIKARPTDVNVRIRLLNLFLETKRYKIAYQHALDIEARDKFFNDHRWYNCLCDVVQAYEKANSDNNFNFFIRKISFLERRADLYLQEFQDEVKSISECSSALFAFDQNLHLVSQIEVPTDDTHFFQEFMKHMQAQLSFHLATLVLKRAKKEYGIWPKAIRAASPLFLQALQNTMDLKNAWYSTWVGKNAMSREVNKWTKSASLRISQAGHIILAWSQNKSSQFLEKVSQFCGGKWQNSVYQDVFYSKEHLQGMSTSHFINEPSFSTVSTRLPTETELKQYDEVAQSMYPDSLHHLVWLGLSYCNASGQLNHDFRCTVVPDLQFSVENLSQTGPETLNQLDVDAFLYASVLCGKSDTIGVVSADRPSRLPVSISEELCSPAQAEWWCAVYDTYKNQTEGNIAEMRLKLRKGIETVRGFGQHGLHVKLIIMLAKLFQERANKNKNPNEVTLLEDRAYVYWCVAIPLLEKIEKNQQIRVTPNRLFDYKGPEMTSNEIKGHIEDGKLFLCCRLMKQEKYEQAVDGFEALKSPYATYYQGVIYEKLASEEVSHRPESLTSENRSQHIILLARARDAFYLTLDRLRCPSVDPNHPLNTLLSDRLEEVEKRLAMIDPDGSLNRNGDTESNETDPAPCSLDIDDNLDSSFNILNANNILNPKNYGTPRALKQNLTEKPTLRFEARPSPERLDAQLRHLVQSNNTGLQCIMEQLKDIKSVMQIELKDLGCVTRDLLAEMRRFNGSVESMLKKIPDALQPEELFNLKEEDYEDINQIPQPYISCQNYLMNRQIPGSQGTSAMAYGTPSPVAAASLANAIPTSENPLLQPSFYAGHQILPSVDPSLLYQNLGYYQGLPYNDTQSDLRGPGIRKELRKMKGVPFSKNSHIVNERISTSPISVPSSGVFTTKAQPPNVVITSSDTLPVFTNIGTPTLSVTIPPQHIRGIAPANVVKPADNPPNAFQMQIPPQAITVKENSLDKLNSPTFNTFSNNMNQKTPTSVSKSSSTPDKSPAIGKTATKETSEKPKSTPESKANILVEKKETPDKKENKLFESHGKLFALEGKEWKEQESVQVKIIHLEKPPEVKIIMFRKLNVSSVCPVGANTVLEPLKNSSTGWVVPLNEFSKNDLKTNNLTGPKDVWRKFCIQFSNADQAKDFASAFKKGLNVLNVKKPKAVSSNSNTKYCQISKKILEEDDRTQPEDISKEKTNLGGFTFTSSPIVKPPVLKEPVKKEVQKETPKPSPFAEFSFATSGNSESGLFSTVSNMDSSNLFASVKADPNSFKKDENFKGFEGQNTLVFGYLNKPKADSSNSDKVPSTAKLSTKDDSEKEEEDEFVPTAEFKPYVDLPDLVDVRTGEENDEVLFNQRTKLLRFDTVTKEWKERGVGNMKVLLNEESGRVRLVMRRELVLKVCCNHYLDENMEFTPLKKSQNALTWYAQDYSEGDLKAELLALRFKNEALMNDFLSVIQSMQAKMKNGRVEGKGEKAPKSDKSKELKPLSELFKPKAGSWECTTCLLRNDEKSVACVSCETPKPGTEGVSKSPQKGMGKGITLPVNTTFKFGIPQAPASTTSTTPASSTFSFGVPQPTASTASTTPVSSTFTFGVPQPAASTASTTSVSSTFTFGVPQSAASTASTTPVSSTFTFGVPQPAASTASTTPVSSKFTFGVSQPAASTASTTPVFSKFTFDVSQPVATVASTMPVSSKFAFGGSAKSTGAESPSLFTFKDVSSNKPTTTTTSSVISSSIFTLSKPNFGVTTTFASPSSTSSPISFSTTSNMFTSSTNAGTPSSKSIFGGAPLKESENDVMSKFTFNIAKPEGVDANKNSNGTTPSFGSVTLKPNESDKFSFSMSNLKSTLSPAKSTDGAASDESNNEEPDEDNGDNIVFTPSIPLPENISLHTGEEDEELLYEQKAKLFRFTEKLWKERGIGFVKILRHKTSKKLRLLMRRDVVLKLCLNHYLTPDIEFSAKDEKSWLWTAPDFSEEKIEYQMFCMRFKTPEIAQSFKQALDDAMKNKIEPETDKPDSKPKTKAEVTSPGITSNQTTVRKSNPSDEDISIIYEREVTPEQRKNAEELLLPPNFYAYLQAPDCPGCMGCDDNVDIGVNQAFLDEDNKDDDDEDVDDEGDEEDDVEDEDVDDEEYDDEDEEVDDEDDDDNEEEVDDDDDDDDDDDIDDDDDDDDENGDDDKDGEDNES